MARDKTIGCLGCGKGWLDAQEFERDGGTIGQLGIAMIATCKCGHTFQAAGLLDASRLRRQRERRNRAHMP